VSYGQAGKSPSVPLILAPKAPPATIRVTVAGKPAAATHALAGGRLTVTLSPDVHLEAGQTLELTAP
jgi:hypothetical protein